MNILDIGIIIFILFGGVIGFKRGFFQQTLSSLGWIAVIILAFLFKDAVALYLINNFPYFELGGVFEGVKSINILIYSTIAFLLLGALFTVILKLLIRMVSVFEKALNFTIFLGIPSKILGALLGMVENYLILFIILYVITLPVFHFKFVEESKLKDTILSGTPIVSKYIGKTETVFNEIVSLKDKYSTAIDSTQFDKDIIKILIDNNIVTEDTIIKLRNQNKLNK